MIFKTILGECLNLKVVFFMSCEDLPAEVHFDSITINFVTVNVAFCVEASFFCFWVYSQSTEFFISFYLSKAFDGWKFSGMISFALSLKCVNLSFDSLNLVLGKLREIVKKVAFLLFGFENNVLMRRWNFDRVVVLLRREKSWVLLFLEWIRQILLGE